MANDFSEDSDVKAVWNFESGAVPFLADSKGGNTLVNQGLYLGAYIRVNSDWVAARFLITDAVFIEKN